MTTSLRQRMTEDMQIRNLSPLTQSSYVQQVSMFARYLDRSPAVLELEDIRDYQLYLTNQKKLDASSIKVAVSAIRFLYRVTLGRPWDFDEAIPSPKKWRTLPIIFSPEEVVHFLGSVTNIKQRTILTTCYAAGLRISEAVHLMPKAVDRQRMVIRIEQGKGRMCSAATATPIVSSTVNFLSTAQRRVMTAIEICRTAALGGHVEQCDACGHQRIYCSALWANSVMGSPRIVLPNLTLLLDGFALHYRAIPEQGDQLVRRSEGAFA